MSAQIKIILIQLFLDYKVDGSESLIIFSVVVYTNIFLIWIIPKYT